MGSQNFRAGGHRTDEGRVHRLYRDVSHHGHNTRRNPRSGWQFNQNHIPLRTTVCLNGENTTMNQFLDKMKKAMLKFVIFKLFVCIVHLSRDSEGPFWHPLML